MFCPECKSQYREGFSRCADCGAQLVDQLPIEPVPQHDDISQFVVAGSYSNQIDADVARMALEAAGIESLESGDDYGGEAPFMGFTRGIDILVRPEDAAAAEELLSEDASALADSSEAATEDETGTT